MGEISKSWVEKWGIRIGKKSRTKWYFTMSKYE